MTKTSGKQPHEDLPGGGPSQQEMQAAYQIHTLANMLYARLAATQPWTAPVQPLHRAEPMPVQTTAPWAQTWPGTCCIGPVDPQVAAYGPVGPWQAAPGVANPVFAYGAANPWHSGPVFAVPQMFGLQMFPR